MTHVNVTTSVVAWRAEPDALVILDQRWLPERSAWETLRTPAQVADAIRVLAVRGAPLIGAAALYGLWLAAHGARGGTSSVQEEAVAEGHRVLAASRPTAVNLFHALADGMAAWRAAAGSPVERASALRAAADGWAAADVAACEAMARLGGALLPDEGGVLTHCNAGALATCGVGTALGVIRAAVAMGKKLRVYADETRPLLQGARLTAWELAQDGLDVTLLPDGASAALLRSGRVQAAVVGADRIAANGDVANKVGTYAVALACREHGVPLWVAAPRSTVDLATPTGQQIVIEERGADEVRGYRDVVRWAPSGVAVFNPAFDVTPAALVAGVITEVGVARPVAHGPLAELMARDGNAPQRPS